ncbi:uncharacterized protein TNCV_236211 [Trichonephila clavipes]|nr:uncharacterized protein TNCV_236211 [Trichonephila clavipes]
MAGLVTRSSPLPQKIRRVGVRCTLNLSRAQMSSRWCGVVVWRGKCRLRCRPRHLTMFQNDEVRRQKPSFLLRVASSVALRGVNESSNVALKSCTTAVGDGPRHFEPSSSDEDFTPTGGVGVSTYSSASVPSAQQWHLDSRRYSCGLQTMFHETLRFHES